MDGICSHRYLPVIMSRQTIHQGWRGLPVYPDKPLLQIYRAPVIELLIRKWDCPERSAHHDSGHNAAINTKTKELSLLGVTASQRQTKQIIRKGGDVKPVTEYSHKEQEP